MEKGEPEYHLFIFFGRNCRTPLSKKQWKCKKEKDIEAYLNISDLVGMKEDVVSVLRKSSLLLDCNYSENSSSASSQVNRPGALPIEVENNPKSEVLFKINWICFAIFV